MSATPLPSSPASKLSVVSTFQRSAASRRRSSRSSKTTILVTPRRCKLPSCRLPIEPQPAIKKRPRQVDNLGLLRHANGDGLPWHQQGPTPLQEPAVRQSLGIRAHMAVCWRGKLDIHFEILGCHFHCAQPQTVVAK